MAQRVIFSQPHRAEVEEFDPAPVTAGTVRVRSSYALISAGTEGIQFRRSFDADSFWATFVRYPYHPGYSTVGVVEEIGPGADGFAVGDRVAVRIRHASEAVVEAKLCTRVPDGVDLEHACWFGLAKIALMAARAGEFRLGDTVAVIGAGPIGQMSLRWAVAAGAGSVVAIDPVPSRLAAATRGGATATVAAGAAAAHDAVIDACGGRPGVVVDSTGNAAVFSEALRLAADHGRVVLIGDTGSPSEQRLTPDVLTRGLRVIGAHDSHSGMARPDWDGDRPLHELFFHLVGTGRFDVGGLVTHVFSPKDCQAAYEVATAGRGDGLGVAFDWTAM